MAEVQNIQYKCDDCNNMFENMDEYNQHANTTECMHNRKKILCDVCGKGFTTERALSTHKKNPFACAKKINQKRNEEGLPTTNIRDIKNIKSTQTPIPSKSKKTKKEIINVNYQDDNNKDKIQKKCCDHGEKITQYENIIKNYETQNKNYEAMVKTYENFIKSLTTSKVIQENNETLITPILNKECLNNDISDSSAEKPNIEEKITVLYPFGELKYDEKHHNEIIDIINKNGNIILQIVEFIHFNSKYPEYANIKITNMRDSNGGSYYNGKKWIKSNIYTLQDKIFEIIVKLVREIIDKYKDKILPDPYRILEKYILYGTLSNKLRDSMKLLLYNKELPRHVLFIKGDNQKTITNNGINTGKERQFIYALLPKNQTEKSNLVIKIGKTRNVTNRFDGYETGSMIIYLAEVKDCDSCESDIIVSFNEKYNRCNYGNEYFKGDIFEMVITMHTILEKRNDIINLSNDVYDFVVSAYSGRQYFNLCNNISDNTIKNISKDKIVKILETCKT